MESPPTPNRPPVRMMSAQDYYDEAKSLRSDIYRLLATADEQDNGQYTSLRHVSNARALLDSLEKARFQIGLSLSVLGGQNPYEKVDNVYDARGEIELEPEADTAPDTLDGDFPEVYMDMRREIEGMIESLKVMHWKMQTGLYKQWFYAHLEKAIMHLSEARCHLGVILKQRTDGHTQSTGAAD